MPKTKTAKNRFQVILEEKHDMMSSQRILKDTETGVLYFYHAWGYGGGLTPLLDPDGRPILDKPVNNN